MFVRTAGSFAEKEKKKHGFYNTGVYLFDRSILSLIPFGKAYSLEYDLFPHVGDKNCYGFVTEANCIDIGTPDGYNTAKQQLLRIPLQKGN
jgi:NDP-sugar pyrophosphorylase family protein